MAERDRNSLDLDPDREIATILDSLHGLLAALPSAPAVARHDRGLTVQGLDCECTCEIGYMDLPDTRWFYAQLRTPLICGVTEVDRELLNDLNLWAVRSGLVWDHEADMIFHHTRIYARVLGGEFFERWTVDHLLLQLGLASDQGDPLLKAVQERAPSARRAPTLEGRGDSVVASVTLAAARKIGQEPSRFIGTFDSLLENPHPSLHGSLEVNATAFGGVFSFPDGADVTRIPMHISATAAVTHQGLGSGLLFILRPPASLNSLFEDGPAVASSLNWLESRELNGANMNGSWFWHRKDGLTHISFLPSMYFGPKVAEYELSSIALRAGWFGNVMTRKV